MSVTRMGSAKWQTNRIQMLKDIDISYIQRIWGLDAIHAPAMNRLVNICWIFSSSIFFLIGV